MIFRASNFSLFTLRLDLVMGQRGFSVTPCCEKSIHKKCWESAYERKRQCPRCFYNFEDTSALREAEVNLAQTIDRQRREDVAVMLQRLTLPGVLEARLKEVKKKNFFKKKKIIIF